MGLFETLCGVKVAIMKILYLSHASELSHGSVKALLSIVAEMQRRGHEPYVLFPQYGEALNCCKAIGIKTSVIPYECSVYPIRNTARSKLTFPCHIIINYLKNVLAIHKINKLIEHFEPDIVHTNVGIMNVGLHAAKHRGIPHVWHIRENAEGVFNFKAFPTFSYKLKLQQSNDANIAITKDIFSTYHLSHNNSYVVYDGVFEKEGAPDVTLKKDNYFLFVGALIQNKGIDWAVNAFLRIKDDYPNYRLLVAGVGDNPFFHEIKTHCNHIDIRNQIEFLGYRTDIYSLMQNAMALLVPSVREGFGFITAEAMYNGCLVLGRNTGGTKEQFDNGVKLTGEEIGLRFETEDQLVELMKMICMNGLEPYKNMMQNAQKTVLASYTSDHNADDILKIYENLIKKQK